MEPPLPPGTTSAYIKARYPGKARSPLNPSHSVSEPVWSLPHAATQRRINSRCAAGARVPPAAPAVHVSLAHWHLGGCGCHRGQPPFPRLGACRLMLLEGRPLCEVRSRHEDVMRAVGAPAIGLCDGGPAGCCSSMMLGDGGERVQGPCVNPRPRPAPTKGPRPRHCAGIPDIRRGDRPHMAGAAGDPGRMWQAHSARTTPCHPAETAKTRGSSFPQRHGARYTAPPTVSGRSCARSLSPIKVCLCLVFGAVVGERAA